MSYRVLRCRAAASFGIYGAALDELLASIVAERDPCKSELARLGVVFAVPGVLHPFVDLSCVECSVCRRSPRAPRVPLGEDAREIRACAVQSTISSGLTSVRTSIPTVLVGVVTTSNQVANFRAAQAPSTAFASLSAPARLVLL